MLKLAQVLPLHVGRAGGSGEALRGIGLRGRRLPVAAFVVDDDFQPVAEFLESRHDLRFVQVIGDHTDRGGLVGDCLVEHLEEGAACLETHPRERFVRLGMRGRKVQSLIRF